MRKNFIHEAMMRTVGAYFALLLFMILDLPYEKGDSIIDIILGDMVAGYYLGIFLILVSLIAFFPLFCMQDFLLLSPYCCRKFSFPVRASSVIILTASIVGLIGYQFRCSYEGVIIGMIYTGSTALCFRVRQRA